MPAKVIMMMVVTDPNHVDDDHFYDDFHDVINQIDVKFYDDS